MTRRSGSPRKPRKTRKYIAGRAMARRLGLSGLGPRGSLTNHASLYAALEANGYGWDPDLGREGGDWFLLSERAPLGRREAPRPLQPRRHEPPQLGLIEAVTPALAERLEQLERRVAHERQVNEARISTLERQVEGLLAERLQTKRLPPGTDLTTLFGVPFAGGPDDASESRPA